MSYTIGIFKPKRKGEKKMPKKLMKQLKAIKKELEALRNGCTEDDFADNFYYVDFQDGVTDAISKIDATLFNATI